MPTDFGTRIRIHREARGWTRAHLAWRANVLITWLASIERGRILHPSVEELEGVAEALGVDAHELLTGRPSPPAPFSDAATNAAVIRDLVSEVVNHGNLAVADAVLTPTYRIRGCCRACRRTVPTCDGQFTTYGVWSPTSPSRLMISWPRMTGWWFGGR